MELGVVSSDAVIESYRSQLSDAHHQIAVLEAQVAKLMDLHRQRELQSGARLRPEVPQTPEGGTS